MGPYGGQEHCTNDFEYVPVNTKSRRPRGPSHCEDENGRYWCAVAKTPWGKIPGKANEEGTCWYPYGGQEHTTDDFDYVRVRRLKHSPQTEPQGNQNDGAGELWCAISKTEHGKIPGKAKDGECWYPYGGEEHSTRNFKYAC